MTIRELLESLDNDGIVVGYDDKKKTMTLSKLANEKMMKELKAHKPMLLRAFTCLKVRQVVESTNGRIVDVGDFETAVMMNERME